jgi:hypothetical protein
MKAVRENDYRLAANLVGLLRPHGNVQAAELHGTFLGVRGGRCEDHEGD